MSYKEGDRVLAEQNGVQFSGTMVDEEHVISDTDGFRLFLDSELRIIRKLTGLEAAKVGDVIVDPDGDEAKILAIDNQHNVFLGSTWGDFKSAGYWYTWKEGEKLGLKLKDAPEDDMVEMTPKTNPPSDKQPIKHKYHVEIKRIERKRNHGLRYGITVWWDKESDRGDVGWAYTLWGARREAKRMIKKHELPPPTETVVEEYEL